MKNREEDQRERRLYTVSEICERMGITRKTLFYYDQIHLLEPSERETSQQAKRYDDEKLQRLQSILQYREAGLCISEIRALLDDQNVQRLSILQNAMKRLRQEQNGVEQEIRKLAALIKAEEKRATMY